MIKKGIYVDFLYGKLPSIYREEDAKLGKPLYRYLQCLSAGGFEKVIEKSNDFLTLVDPEKCPEEFFPYLYESFGLTYTQDIPIEYHRKFLNNIGVLMKRRGTKTAIRYLVSTLTGYDIDLSYQRKYNISGECVGRFLYMTFPISSLSELKNVATGAKVIEQFLKFQLPFYITPVVSAHYGEKSVIEGTKYVGGVIGCFHSYTLTPMTQENIIQVEEEI